jgi:hypothetical protein
MLSLLLFDSSYAAMWWRVVTPGWVHDVAERYAERLLGSVEVLAVENGAVR